MLSGLLSELSLVQWIFIGLGLLIMAPSLFSTLGKAKKLALDVLGSIKVPESKPKPVINGHKLTDLVCKWERLYEDCKESNLDLACSKMEEVFPLLTKKTNVQDPEKDEENSNE